MNEADARAWLADRFDVSRETCDRLSAYVALVEAEQVRQNLVSAATLSDVWGRHIIDSAQLLGHADGVRGPWLDIGSGAGLPGIVLAILSPAPITLVEPRALRADFLRRVAERLALTHVEVKALPLARVETQHFAVITARAVAALPSLVAMATRFARNETVWLLPKGKSALAELESLPKAWHKRWDAQQSVTDPASFILVGRGIFTKGRA